ncbi:hypothetical protein E4U53_004585 [Claviceps sorghi]|nr:hypothetical protein E4U53_004585 [Claviceps sorghi]
MVSPAFTVTEVHDEACPNVGISTQTFLSPAELVETMVHGDERGTRDFTVSGPAVLRAVASLTVTSRMVGTELGKGQHVVTGISVSSAAGRRLGVLVRVEMIDGRNVALRIGAALGSTGLNVKG